MPVKSPRRRKFPQFRANHVFADKHRNEFPAIMDSQCDTDHLRHNG